MKRYSILSLMVLVLSLAMGFAALRNADEYWAGGLLLATPAILGITLIGGLCGAELRRARRLGFAILGGGYFALAFLGLSEGNLEKLPTTKLLRYVHERAGPSPTGTLTLRPVQTGIAGSEVLVNYTVTAVNITPSDSAWAIRWKRLLPGAAAYDAFQTVGHCLFAGLAGLIGAIVARGFERGRVRAAAIGMVPEAAA